jgi:hypothetical protein
VGNLARKIIDAVQNSMLDKLVARLFPLLWVFTFWDRLAPSDSWTGFMILIFALLGLFALYWVIGAIADEPPRPRRRRPFDQLHERPVDGFSAWEKLPPEGLRPPALIRCLVMTLGVRGPSWISVIEVLALPCTFGLTWMLAYKSGTFWTGVHQALAEQTVREQVFLAAAVVLTVLILRGWAVEQRQRISPSPAPGLPVLGSILLGVAFTAMLGMIVSEFLGFGLLAGAMGGIGLLAVAIGPPWRDKVLEFLFGKREPVDGRP